jgi:hypothetical protein
VDSTLEDIKGRIKTFFDSTASEIEDKTAELERLKKEKKPDTDAIAKAEKQLAHLQKLHAAAKDARKTLNKDLTDEQKQLRGLSRQYDITAQKIEDATQALKDAKQAQLDFAASTAADFSKLPDIGADETFSSFADKTRSAEEATKKFDETLAKLRKDGLSDAAYQQLLKEGVGAQGFLDKVMEDGKAGIDQLNTLGEQFATQKHTALDTYLNSVRSEAADVEKFKATLDQLKALGMDDTTYNKLLQEGVSAQPFLDELLASGATGIGELNALNARLSTAAQTLGNQAALDLKQAGVDSAQGLLDGLNSQMDKIASSMKGIAKIIVRAVKKELKIKSPSKVMEEVGKFTNQGLAGGIDKYSHIVDKSAATMANSAVDTIKTTLTGLQDHAMTDVNTNPVIAPVLDLTQVQKDSAVLNKMLEANAQVSYKQALGISADQQAAQTTATTESSTAAPAPVLNFTQNNNSPKALSPVEIYRQTKNQLSLAKEALNA